MVQWLELCVFTANGMDPAPGRWGGDLRSQEPQGAGPRPPPKWNETKSMKLLQKPNFLHGVSTVGFI